VKAPVEDYEHIINTLIALWDEPEVLCSYLSGLVMMDRRDRQGFTPEVIDDLMFMYVNRCQRLPDIWSR
jgi:hypothetical protein